MIDIFTLPIVLSLILVAIHAWFGSGILSRGIIFTDLAIAQMAALGSAISLGYFHGEYLYVFTLVFALFSGLIIAYATTLKVQLEAFIGLFYVLGASGILMLLAHSAEGMEHFKSLLANDLLFTTEKDFMYASSLYFVIAIIAWKIYPKTAGIGREILFFTLLSITVTSSVQLAGVLVVFVLLIAPILVASMQKRFPPYPFAVIFGGTFSIVAMILSFYADLPTGYTMVSLTAFVSLITIIVLSTKKNVKVL